MGLLLVLWNMIHGKQGYATRREDNQSIARNGNVSGGVTYELTRDISEKQDRPSKEHGSIKEKV